MRRGAISAPCNRLMASFLDSFDGISISHLSMPYSRCAVTVLNSVVRERAKVRALASSSHAPSYSTTLFSGYSTMPVALRRLKPRNHVTRRALIHNRVHRNPLRVAQLRNGRRIQRRQNRQRRFKVRALHVQHQPHLRLRIDCAAQHQGDLFQLLALPRVGHVLFCPRSGASRSPSLCQ